jgi:hypothetical protein
MTFKLTPPSLEDLDKFSKSANSLLTTIAFGAALVFVIVQSPRLSGVTDTMLTKLAQVQSVEGFNIKMAFNNEATVLEALPVYKEIDTGQRTTLRADLNQLDGDTLPRLLNVGALDGTCEFDRTTPGIRAAYETDERLHDLGLVEMRNADDVKTRVVAQMKATIEQGKEWEAGAPRHCYRMTLTGRGWRVKSAVLEFLSNGLTHASPGLTLARAPKPVHVASGD